MSSEGTVKCSRCTNKLAPEAFPRGRNLKPLKTCHACTAKQQTFRQSKRGEKEDPPLDEEGSRTPPKRKGPEARDGTESRMSLSWGDFIGLVTKHRSDAFELDAEINLTDLLEDQRAAGNHEIARDIANKLWKATGYRFVYKKCEKSRTSDSIKSFAFFCAQLHGEETKQKLNENSKKRRARMTMDRFECNGRLRITMVDGSPDLAGVKITHHRPHSQYVDISLTDKVDAIIQSMINMPASKAWDSILAQKEQGELTEKQIYARWAQLNEEKWRLDDDQVSSATKLLQSKEGHEVEIIPTIREDGISAVAFTFKGILEDVGGDIVEVAMDSTWKTNAAGYELYGLVGELNGRAVPLASCFTASTDGTALEGAKDRLLRTVIRFVAKKCANIKFTLSDKDLTEINGFRTEIPHARHQLCYWHGVRYIEERLAQDKPPAKYSAIRANKVFNFIDPTWAPGVSSGWLEEGVHESDAEVEQDAEPMPLDVDISKEVKERTCRPPVLVITVGNKRIPIWPAPPKISETDRPIFCGKEHRTMIVAKFRIHFHQHPAIPFDDEKGTYFTAEEIHHGAVKDMYQYCFENNLSQVWAYMWNRWYTPNQWSLWARSASHSISRLKTTMVVENLWKHFKRRDLAQFNRPRLDLVTHLVISGVLPRVQLTIDSVLGRRRIGRAKALAPWQTEFKRQWIDMGKSDEERLVQKELTVRKGNLKGKEREERLAQIAEEEMRDRGTHHTSVDKWTCSCPSYLTSRFLLCKHLVRKANTTLNGNPCTNLRFFSRLCRARDAPFYDIPGIHSPEPNEHREELEDDQQGILILGGYTAEMRTRSREGSESLRSDTGSSGNEDSGDGGGLEGTRQEESGSLDNSLTEHDTVGTVGEDPEDNEPRIHFSPAKIMNLKRCFDDILGVAASPTGIHPKMASIFANMFQKVEEVGGDIGKDKRRRKNPQTWRDSTKNTLYLD